MGFQGVYGLIAPSRWYLLYCRYCHELQIVPPENQALQQKLGEAGRLLVKHSYSWEGIAHDLDAVYQEFKQSRK